MADEAQTLALMSEALGRMIYARTHGMQYSGERDLYKVGGYPRSLGYRHFRDTYDRDPVAGRLVDMVAETTWRKPPDVNATGAKGDTDFSRAWEGLVKRLGVWGRLERAHRMARIGRYSVVLVGVAEPDGVMTQPLGRLSGPDAVEYMTCYPEDRALVSEWVTDPRDPRYGLPERYNLQAATSVPNFQATALSVHWTRCVHVAEGLMEDDVYGRPVLERVYNDLADLAKVGTSTAEAFWQRVAGILHGNFDPDAQVSAAELNTFKDELAAIYHDLRRTVITKGVDLKRLSESEPNPAAAATLYMRRIAAGEGIPMRMLFGSETGERASTEDQKSFLGSMEETRTQFAEPLVLRPFIDRLMDAGALPRAEYTVVWPSLVMESEKDMADANRTKAEAARALTPVGGMPLDYVEIDEDRNIWLRPTGERGQMEPDLLEPPEPEPPPMPPGLAPDADEPEAEEFAPVE
jgi:hypothetical protein